MHEIILWP